MSKYSTIGGQVTKAETFTKLIHHIEEAADQAAILSHLHNTEDSTIDKTIAKGWLGISKLLVRMKVQVTKLAMNKFQ